MFPSSRQAIGLGLGFVAVLSLAAIPPTAVVLPALAVALLFLAPGAQKPRPIAATTSSRLRAIVIPSTADALLWMALGAAIGLAYLLVVLQW